MNNLNEDNLQKSIFDDYSKELKINNEYTSDKICVLEGLEAVRKRPGMYIGSTSVTGLHHLVYEIIDNSIDEALAGFCFNINVILNKDNSITIIDDGRGIPPGIVNKIGKSAIEVVFTILHAGGKFGGGGYKISGGLHGVGASVTNALSEWLEVEVCRDGKKYFQRYERGKICSPVKEIGDSSDHGTKVTFLPDIQIFNEIKFNYDILKKHFREMAFLTKGLKISIKDNRTDEGQEDSFCYEGGIKEFVKYLNIGKKPLYDNVLYFNGIKDKIYVEVAFQHNDTYTNNICGFVNNVTTPEGGYHLDGFNLAILKVLNKFLNKGKKDKKFISEDVKEGVVAIISIKIENPQFEGQTKQKLGNIEVKDIVKEIVAEKYQLFLEQNPKIAELIINKALKAQKVREAARIARNMARKSVMEGSNLPGKLSDCIDKDPKNCEIFIVEGISAGGSAKTARIRTIQAILPLKGKILNVEKAREDKIYENEEIKSMITAFGTGVRNNFDITKLRYNKIIIMADADVDGEHISTLVLTFLYRYMPELIKKGHVYLAQPPLYKIERNKKIFYAYNDEQLNNILNEIGRDGNNKIQRYKGLGEMDASQLWETTMDPEKRILNRVIYNEDDKIETELIFSTLMGDQVAPRRDFIEKNAKYATNLDI